MPIAQILQSLKGTCRFCRQQAGLLQRDHQDCQETHRSGWQEMVQLAAQAASAHTFNEAALRQTLQAIANRSRRIIRSRVEGDTPSRCAASSLLNLCCISGPSR